MSKSVRSKQSSEDETEIEIVYDEHRPIVIDLSISHLLLSKVPKKDRAAAIALYLFYYHNAVLQEPNAFKCTNSDVKGSGEEGLGWHTGKISRIRKILKKYGLVQFRRSRNKNGSLKEAEFIDVSFAVGETEPNEK
jgi:hypothetical protein